MSKSANHVPTPDGSVVRNTTRRGSKQTLDDSPGFKQDEVTREEPDVFSRLGSRDRLRCEQRPDPKSRSERQTETEKEWYAVDRANRKALTPATQATLSESEIISGFMHDITNPDLIKRLNDNIQKSVDVLISVTITFLKGEVSVANQSRKKGPSSWKHHESVSLVDKEYSTSTWMNFMIVRSLSLYNGIIRRPGIKKIQVVPSTAHEIFKFPVSGVVTLHSSRITPVECRMVAESSSEPIPKIPVEEKKGIKVAIYPEYLDQIITIGGSLTEKGRMELYDLLKSNLNVFS
ncbi:hypothetical protein Tco_0767800 [Tanacetum coccineum]